MVSFEAPQSTVLIISWSHFILSGLKYDVLASKNKYNVLIEFIFYCKTFLLLLRWDI